MIFLKNQFLLLHKHSKSQNSFILYLFWLLLYPDQFIPTRDGTSIATHDLSLSGIFLHKNNNKISEHKRKGYDLYGLVTLMRTITK